MHWLQNRSVKVFEHAMKVVVRVFEERICRIVEINEIDGFCIRKRLAYNEYYICCETIIRVQKNLKRIAFCLYILGKACDYVP